MARVKVDKVKRNINKKKILGAIILIGCIVGLCIYQLAIVNKNEGEIFVVHSSESIYEGQLITEANLKMGSMTQKDYDAYPKTVVILEDGSEATVSLIVPWERRDYLLNKYASYFIRKDTAIYSDIVSYEKPNINPWLYEVPEGYEIYKFKVSPQDVAGNLVMPGDIIRMRAVFQISKEVLIQLEEKKNEYANEDGALALGDMVEVYQDFVEPLETEPLYMLESRTVPKSEVLTFDGGDSIRIIDMLNTQGDSIFDIYMELLKMPLKDRVSMLQQEDFKIKLVPESMLLTLTRKEMDAFVECLNLKNVSFEYSLLPRNEKGTLVEKFMGINSQIENIFNDYPLKSIEGEKENDSIQPK